jgi:hypothetical protein
VSKAQLYAIGFSHAGQTEFVAERCGVGRDNIVMMLAGPTLRTVPVTTHVALADVPGLLTRSLLIARALATLRGLRRDFGIGNPRVAVAGLNPHAGEGGALGREEIEIIAPAIAELQADGHDVTGRTPPTRCSPARRRELRRGAVPLPRSGVDPAESAALRRRRQHDSWPADRPHRARSRHGLCACRARRRRTRRDDSGDPHGRRLRGAPPRGSGRLRRVTAANGLPPLREVIARHGLSANKALGQNFLLDGQLLARIAAVPGPLAGQAVYEVGPGRAA